MSGFRTAAGAAVAALLGAVLAQPAPADDGNLQHRLSVQQERDDFAAKLDRLRAEAREREAQARASQRAPIGEGAEVPARSHQSMRLTPQAVPERAPPRDDGTPAYEPYDPNVGTPDLRDEALRSRQRHRALTSDIGPSTEAGTARDSGDRYELNRAQTERKRSDFQRKLTR